MIFTKTRDVKSPARGTSTSAGIDFFVPNDHAEVWLEPGQSVNIPSGIKVVLPTGVAGIFFNKSSLGSYGIFVGACVVDSDYRGEVHLNVHNVGSEGYFIKPGQKLVQMILTPIRLDEATEVDDAMYLAMGGETERGSGGFGSTGQF